MLTIRGFGSRKTNELLNLIKEAASDNLVEKIYLYVKDLNELKYQFLIKKHEDVGINHLNDPQEFIEYSAYMDDVYNNINETGKFYLCLMI